MTRYLNLHPETPQSRLLSQTVEGLRAGDLIIYPTDSCYALGCMLSNKAAVETIRTLRKLQPNHPLTLVCADIAQAAQYAKIDDKAFKWMKNLTPGPYTFILPALKSVPKLVQGAKRKEVGIRIPNHPVPAHFLNQLNAPLLSSTLWFPDEEAPVFDLEDLPKDKLGYVNLVLDAGPCGMGPTTVVDLTSESPNIIREGAGDVGPFQV